MDRAPRSTSVAGGGDSPAVGAAGAAVGSSRGTGTLRAAARSAARVADAERAARAAGSVSSIRGTPGQPHLFLRIGDLPREPDEESPFHDGGEGQNENRNDSNKAHDNSPYNTPAGIEVLKDVLSSPPRRGQERRVHGFQPGRATEPAGPSSRRSSPVSSASWPAHPARKVGIAAVGGVSPPVPRRLSVPLLSTFNPRARSVPELDLRAG